MRRTCRALPSSEARRAWAYAGSAALVLSAACAPQNGIVGAEPPPDGGASSAGGSGSLQTPTYRTEFDLADGWQTQNKIAGSSIQFGVADSNTDAAELRFPGHPDFSANDKASATEATEIESPRQFGFGVYRARVTFGACQPNEEVVSAALGFLSDGTDANQNGLTDDEEIDLQVICGARQRLYLTVFTDYEASSGEFRKLSRLIDFGTGEVFDTKAPDDDTFVKAPPVAAWVRPELFGTDTFYVVGYEWHASSLRFFLELDGREQTLWTLSDAERVPQRPVTFLFNLWHPDTHWYPASGGAAYPAQDVVMHVDWFEYSAE